MMRPIRGVALPAIGALWVLSSAAASDLVVPPSVDPRIHEIVSEISAERIETDIRKLVGFGTRNTLSDTESETRGIGAARRVLAEGAMPLDVLTSRVGARIASEAKR